MIERRTCSHEACHAVIATHLGFEVRSVRIYRGEHSSGMIEPSPPGCCDIHWGDSVGPILAPKRAPQELTSGETLATELARLPVVESEDVPGFEDPDRAIIVLLSPLAWKLVCPDLPFYAQEYGADLSDVSRLLGIQTSDGRGKLSAYLAHAVYLVMKHRKHILSVASGLVHRNMDTRALHDAIGKDTE